MRFHKMLDTARLLLELALPISGCQPAFAADPFAPPAMICRVVEMPAATPSVDFPVQETDEAEGAARRIDPATLSATHLDCRLDDAARPLRVLASTRGDDDGRASAATGRR